MAARRSELVLLLALLAPLPAHAGGEGAAAEALFREARALMDKGKHADACPKLEEAMRLDPTGMTAFVLGECLERTGKTASAWARFAEAQEFARKKGAAAKAKEIEQRMTALEPKLARLTVQVTKAVPGLEVRRDELAVGSGSLGSAVPVDPGEHEITAQAPGRKPWKKRVAVSAGAKVTVEVPELEADAAKPSVSTAPTATAPPPATTTGDRAADETAGHGRSYAAFGLGAVAVLAGGYFMLQRSSAIDDIHALCPDTCTPADTPRKDELRSTALKNTWLGAGFLTVGVTAIGVGAVWWKQDGRKETGLRVGPGAVAWSTRW